MFSEDENEGMEIFQADEVPEIEELSEEEENDVTGGYTAYSRTVVLRPVNVSTSATSYKMTSGSGRTIASIQVNSNGCRATFTKSLGNVTVKRGSKLGTVSGKVTYTGGAYYTFSIKFK